MSHFDFLKAEWPELLDAATGAVRILVPPK
jgi:hypothetical protein